MKQLFDGDRLGQVTRLIDILTLAYSDMICQKLQRNGGYQWFEALHDIRQFNHLVGDMGNGITGNSITSSAIWAMVSSPFDTRAITLP